MCIANGLNDLTGQFRFCAGYKTFGVHVINEHRNNFYKCDKDK